MMCCETSAHASDCPNNPNSLGFDEPGLWMVDEWVDEGVVGAMHKPSDADLLAAVRRGVESGTIKGEEGWWCLTHLNGVVQRDTFPPDTCWSFNADADSCLLVDATVVVGPVSDGGSET